MYRGETILSTAIRLSLRALDEKCEEGDTDVRFSFSEMFTSLSVLKRQQLAPVSVLANLWETTIYSANKVCLEFSSMSLTQMHSQEKDARDLHGIVIRDLLLDFCRHVAIQEGTYTEWRWRLH